MRSRSAINTAVVTVLITLIIFVVILTMDHDRTTNMIEGIVLASCLFLFAGVLSRSSESRDRTKA